MDCAKGRDVLPELISGQCATLGVAAMSVDSLGPDFLEAVAHLTNELPPGKTCFLFV